MDVSVVVSSYNRREDIARLLESFKNTVVAPGRQWEVIIVDNNSNDGTADLVEQFRRTVDYSLRCIVERIPGKSQGVNTGLAAARGRFIALTDDDAIIPSDWVDRIIDYFEAHPDAVCIGGMVKRYDPEIAPVSIRLSTEPAVVDATTFAVTAIPIIGCNMAVRAETLRQIGYFDTDLGPGTRLKAAEDVDILYRVIRAGHRIHYVPEIYLYHNHGRKTEAQVAPVNAGYLVGRGAFYCKYILQRDMLVARWAYWEFRSQLGWNWLKAPFNARSRASLKALWLLAVGAINYLRFRRPQQTPVPSSVVSH